MMLGRTVFCTLASAATAPSASSPPSHAVTHMVAPFVSVRPVLPCRILEAAASDPLDQRPVTDAIDTGWPVSADRWAASRIAMTSAWNAALTNSCTSPRLTACAK